MEKVLTNGFCEMTQDESVEIGGGLGPVAWCVIGYVGGAVVDGILTSTTGKSASGWVSEGINAVKGWF